MPWDQDVQPSSAEHLRDVEEDTRNSYSVLFADDPGAVLEKSVLGEWAASVIRLALVLSLGTMFFLFTHQDATSPLIAYTVLATAGVYSVYLLWREPYRHHDFLISSTFVSATDTLLVIAFLYATGSFTSPYYPLLYASVVGFSFRYGPWETLAGALLHSGGYAALLYATGDLVPNFTDASIRIGFIFLLAALGSLLGMVAARQTVAKESYRDVAEELDAARSKLTRRTEELERSNQDLERFASAISHDLREPLRMIASYLDLIEERAGDELDEEIHEFMAYAKGGAERLDRMVQGLLEYSRVDQKGNDLRPVELEQALGGAVQNLAQRIDEQGATIEQGSLARVRGDPDQLTQVFQNLISNALDYRSEKDPVVRVDAKQEGDAWRVSVQDNGVGIDPDERESIFRMFQRGSPTGSAQGEGIGLALCERIVERHGGKMWVEETSERGSTFCFTLPAEEASEPA